MMRSRNGVLTVGLLALSCSGRYEVGGMGDAATGGSGDLPVAGASGEVAGTGGSDSGGTPPVTGGTLGVAGGANAAGSSCVPAGEPEPLSGPFASPAIVWARLSPLIWGRAQSAQTPFPAQTSYAWAAELVDSELQNAFAASQFSSSLNAVPGPRAFLQSWLHLPEDAELSPTWNELLHSEAPALQLLLLRPLSRTHVGVFTEPAWLRARPNISRRGYVMVEALFGTPVPPPPPSEPPLEPSDGLTERERLEQQVHQAPCSACHRMFDPLGVSLEHFDSAGEFVGVDAGKPVDSSGTYQLPVSGELIVYADNSSCTPTTRSSAASW
jgi:hypothetical protein